MRKRDEDNDDDNEDRRSSDGGRLDRHALPARAQESYPDSGSSGEDLVDSAKANTPGFGDRFSARKARRCSGRATLDQDAENLKEFNAAAAASTTIDDGPNGTKICASGKRLDVAVAAHQERRWLAFRRSPRKGGNDKSPGRLQRAQRH